MKLFMFRTVPLSIIRRFSLYTQQWYKSYSFADSLQEDQDGTGSMHCCVYSEKLFMMGRGTVLKM
jgi:hypothetical protein